MKAKLIKIEKKELKTKAGAKFSKIEFTCDVKINDKGDVKTYKGSYSEDYARRYFAYCKVTTKDLIGKEVDVSLAKRTYEHEGESRYVNYIKWLNVLDKDGNIIKMPSENSTTDLDF